MTLQEAEAKVRELDEELEKLTQLTEHDLDTDAVRDELKKAKERVLKLAYQNLTSYDRVYLARKSTRPNVREYIENLFDNFFEQRGDRLYRDDGAIIGGIATFNGTPVTVIGNLKGRNLEENIKCNFGMANPEGYRKALRLMKQAEKFKRPIITFIDTSGAYPGIEAEKHGQAEAIARNLMEMCSLTVPIIAIVIGEGGSGGALALSVANRIWMLENAIYSILSPEGFATILWKDGSRAKEASELMKLTAADLLDLNVIDLIIQEPIGNLREHADVVYNQIRSHLVSELAVLSKMSERALLDQRYKKFRSIGDCSSL
ncbi:MAG: acetyl-CoA carboxylase carboxyltransferase subunit alpha [Clostridiales bacterium]|jgi:acetyl-CoA carboxylase carboxyl transferase subunit alpha|nr:acetyl-CoA carboxylase carboxyltransferase subunit alpha [Clostridiales bacterium]